MRLAVPDRIRAAHPELPRELKRSTKLSQKGAALAQARKMCLQFAIRYSTGANVLATPDHPRIDEFSLHYSGGQFRATYPQNASIETLIHLGRCLEKLTQPAEDRTKIQSIPAHAIANASVPLALAAPVVDVAIPAPLSPTAEPPDAELPINKAADGNEEPVWLSDAIDDWRKNGGTTFSSHTWRSSYAASFRVFREIVGHVRRDRINSEGVEELSILDIKIRDLTRNHILALHRALKVLPANQGKNTALQEAGERIREGQENKSRAPTRTSVEKKLGHVLPCVDYMKRQGWVTLEVLDAMSLAMDSAQGDKAKEAKHKSAKGYVALSPAELERMFVKSNFVEYAFDAPWRYWIPLICLLQGCRVAEGPGLFTDDLKYVDGVPCLSFISDDQSSDDLEDAESTKDRKIAGRSAHEYRRLKNHASRRIVPLHPKLIQLGFIEFFNSVADISTVPTQLFYGLRWDEKSMFGRKPSRYMRGLLVEQKIWVRRRKVPHSLRSNFIQKLSKTVLSEEMQSRLVGHATGKLKDEHYHETDDGPAVAAALVLPCLAQIDFGLHIPTWDEVCRMAAASPKKGRKRSPAGS